MGIPTGHNFLNVVLQCYPGSKNYNNPKSWFLRVDLQKIDEWRFHLSLMKQYF